MSKLRKLFALGVVFYTIASVVYFGGSFNNAIAGISEPLTLENAKGETLTVGSVSTVSDGTNLIIDFNTDSAYPLFFTVLTFRGNTDGVKHADSSARTAFLAKKSGNHHSYIIPLAEITNEGVTIMASADVIVNGAITSTRKAFVSVPIKVPPKETTTTQPPTTVTTQPPTTTTTEKAATTTTTEKVTTTTEKATTTTTEKATTTTTAIAVAATTTTTKPVTTTTTAAPTTTTTVAAVTATTVAQVTTTTLPEQVVAVAPRVVREVLPITGSDYNWYLIGIMIALTGAGMYLGSLRRTN